MASTSPPADRNLGEQPLARLLLDRGLKPHDLVIQAPATVTHKLVARACKGRWLTPHSRQLVLGALNRAAGTEYRLEDLFNY